MDDMREGLAPLVDAQWADDKEAPKCKLCEQKFTATKRRVSQANATASSSVIYISLHT